MTRCILLLTLGLNPTAWAQDTETTAAEEPAAEETAAEETAAEGTAAEEPATEGPQGTTDTLPPSSNAEEGTAVQPSPSVLPPLPPTTEKSPPNFKPEIRPVADLRTELVAARLDNLDPRVTEQEPQVFFSVSRARLGFAGRLSPSFSLLSRIEIAQASETVEHSTYTGDALELQTYPDHWRVQLWDLAGTWDCGAWGSWTMGLQPKEFGVRTDYENDFYLPGTHHPFSMAEQRGVIPSQAMGLGWSRALGSRVHSWVQVSNTVGSTESEHMIGKDISGRLRLQAVEHLFLTAAALMGPRDVYGQQLAWTLAADVETGAFRALAEYITDKRGESSASGWGLTLAHEKSLARGLESARALLRIQAWDPDDTEGKDRDVTLTGSYLLSWTTLGKSELLTGLTYEVLSPEDQYEAIQHGLVGQARIRF